MMAGGVESRDDSIFNFFSIKLRYLPVTTLPVLFHLFLVSRKMIHAVKPTRISSKTKYQGKETLPLELLAFLFVRDV